MKKDVINFLENEISLKHIPGAIIHVAHKGEVLLEEAVGYRSVKPELRKMELDTIFDLASLTKVVATLPAILKLIDYGSIRLDDKIGLFFPEFNKNGKENVTIKHLLTHTSGLIWHREYFKMDLMGEQIVKTVLEEELQRPIGKVEYSDLGYILLYKLIEKVADKEFTVFLEQEVFKPLEMNDTSFLPKQAESKFAYTEYSEKLGKYKAGIVHDDNTEAMGGISGHAGLFSTVGDLAKFCQMVENNGCYKNKQILSESSLRLSRKNYTSEDEDFRGLGWQLKGLEFASCGDYFSKSSYGHTGFTGTSIWFDPEVNLRVILLTNRVHFGRIPQIIRLRPRLHNIIRKNF